MMLGHGSPKLMQLLQGQGDNWVDPLGWGSTFSLMLCVFAEFVCSIALLVGFYTRIAALVLALNFGVVVFLYGEHSSWAQNELPLLYFLCFLTLVCTGAGGLSMDAAFVRRRRQAESEADRLAQRGSALRREN